MTFRLESTPLLSAPTSTNCLNTFFILLPKLQRLNVSRLLQQEGEEEVELLDSRFLFCMDQFGFWPEALTSPLAPCHWLCNWSSL